jgi:hypothetical protein
MSPVVGRKTFALTLEEFEIPSPEKCKFSRARLLLNIRERFINFQQFGGIEYVKKSPRLSVTQSRFMRERQMEKSRREPFNRKVIV